MFRALIAFATVSAACGARPTPAPPVPRPAPASAAEPVDPRAIAICDRWSAVVTRCPDLDYLAEPEEQCRRTYSSALADPVNAQAAGDVNACIVQTGACSEITGCLRNTVDGLYAVTSFAVDPDCASHAPGKHDPPPRLGQTVDLGPLHASRGKPLLVTFTAIWESSSKQELARLRTLARQDDIQVVAVLSNTTAELAELDATVGPRVIVDAPRDGENLGPITQAWGVQFVPHSFVIDAAGAIRHDFERMHDWASPGAAACLRSVARAR